MAELNFTFSRIPRIEFGAGKLERLPELARPFGSGCLLITGGSSLERSGNLGKITRLLERDGFSFDLESVTGEPSPDLVDEISERHRGKGKDFVLAAGGGSVIDAGKAVAAMLTRGNSVLDHMEKLSDSVPHPGTTLPLIAVPTTAGTGSEATKNAVLSRTGNNGFKSSVRHENFIPRVALVDPELTLGSPPEVSASCGMDAFTQLLEAYVSTGSSPMTDALALDGMRKMRGNLIPACGGGSRDISVRCAVSYGALISGIVLANAGLGVVHGMAAAIGGLFPVPHGVFCGSVLASATAMNITRLKETAADDPALEKYASVGRMLGRLPEETPVKQACAFLVEELKAWTEKLALPRLGAYGVREKDIGPIVALSGIKNNPVPLDDKDLAEIIGSRLS